MHGMPNRLYSRIPEVEGLTYEKKVKELKEILIEELEKQFEEEGINTLNVTNKIVNVYEKGKAIEIEMTYEVQTNIGIEEKMK